MFTEDEVVAVARARVEHSEWRNKQTQSELLEGVADICEQR